MIWFYAFNRNIGCIEIYKEGFEHGIEAVFNRNIGCIEILL